MWKKRFFAEWGLWGSLCLSPDDGSGAGAGGSEGGDSGDDDSVDDDSQSGDPVYTEQQLKDRIEDAIRKRLAKTNREIAVKDRELSGLKSKIAELQDQNTDLTEALKQAKENPGKRTDGEIDLITKQHQREVAALQEKLDKETSARKSAEEAHRQGERNRLLDEALQAAGCKDMKAGRRYFSPQVKWDEIESRFMFETESGGMVEIKDGVADELPDYLRPPAMGGGSGSQGGNPRKAAKRSELQKAEKDLQDAIRVAQQSGMDNSAVVRVSTLRKKVKELKADLV